MDRLIEIGLSYILFFPSLSLSLGYRYTYIVGLGFLRGMRKFFSKFHSINRLFNDLSFFLIRLFDSMEIRINLFKKKLRFINSINLLNLNTRENKLFILFF